MKQFQVLYKVLGFYLTLLEMWTLKKQQKRIIAEKSQKWSRFLWAIAFPSVSDRCLNKHRCLKAPQCWAHFGVFVTEDVCLPWAGQCNHSEFWNSDLDVCVPCSSCKMYPKTPSCNTCKTLTKLPAACRRWRSTPQFNGCFVIQPPGKSVEEPPDVWKLAAITSFSVLAVVLIGAALIIGVMVHRRKSHKRPLRGEALR